MSASTQPDGSFGLGIRAILIWVAMCNFVTVGAATYLSSGHTLVFHVVAWIVALGVGVGAALSILSLAGWAGAPPANAEPGRIASPPDAAVEEREPSLGQRTTAAQLMEQLTLGQRLQAHLRQAIADETPNAGAQSIPEIDGWIGATRMLLADKAPELAHRFVTEPGDAPEPIWPPRLEDAINLSQSGRLERHLARLTEILSG